jgi:hypothetical protein
MVVAAMAEISYSPGRHTLDALVAQLDLLTSNHPEAFVVGSIGRAAILGDEITPRKRWGAARDIDLTTTNGEPLVFGPEESEPFSVDSSFERLITVDHFKGIATVRYDARRPDISVELPAEVFAPYRTAVGGLPVNTFHPDTMRKLHLIYASGGPRDNRGQRELEQRLRQVTYLPLPDRFFEPLGELASMVAADRQLRLQRRLEHLQDVYIDAVPFPVRRRLDPMLRSVKHTFVMGGRRQPDPSEQQASRRRNLLTQLINRLWSW